MDAVVDIVARERRSPDGVSTNDLILSARQGTNDELFPDVLALYVADGATIADTTLGQGVFWKRVPVGRYRVLQSDLMWGIDARDLPYESDSLDAVVFDPPYMHSTGGTAHSEHQNFETYYRNNVRSLEDSGDLKYHDAVLHLYLQAAKEASRVLRDEGVYIVKCQDEVCANRQRLTHCELIAAYETMGFVVEDLFVLMRHGKPGVSRMVRQMHARKAHSYFVIARKSLKRGVWKGPGR